MDTTQVWVPDPVEGYVQATIIKKLWEKINVETIHGKALALKPSEAVPYREDLLAEGAQDDMIELPELNEPTLLWALSERYMKDEIYTYIGPMIISVNPFKVLPIYEEENIREYLGKTSELVPPHVFSIANKCFEQITATHKSQSVVISGESGAGKTEATKYVLKFLTSVIPSARDNKGDLGTRILATNPVLEAFGNAKTVRNNNSSRFGKFIKVALNGGMIVGGKIDSYLLEKTRILHQDPGERNFHIFYQLLLGSSPAEKVRYGIKGGPEYYHYLKDKNCQIQGVDDAADFQRTKDALQTLGISTEEKDEYFTILSGILLLGNIDFPGDDPLADAKLQDRAVVAQISKLLRVDPVTLETTLTLKTMTMRGETVRKPLSRQIAFENRDGMAKALYSKLFNHLVSKLNEHLVITGQNPNFDLFIGVLDIYGFENFQNNSLEQFCINYANEKLHCLFVNHVLHAEQEEYKEEGVSWDQISFTDNKDTVYMIEGKGNMLAMLDDESKRPGASDVTYTSGLNTKFSRHIRFGTVVSSQTAFIVKHYAEETIYNTTGFIVKNKDQITTDVVKLLCASKSALIASLFEEDLAIIEQETQGFPSSPRQTFEGRRSRMSIQPTNGRELERSLSGVAPRSSDSVTKKFSYSLSTLIQTLEQTDIHYIRCIKPNMEAKPDLFMGSKVLSQLRSNGVLETVKLRKAGYSVRIAIESFYKRYNIIDNLSSGDDIVEYLCNIIEESDFALGKTKVFLKSIASDVLEGLRAEYFEGSCTTLQSFIRRKRDMDRLAVLREERRRRVVKIQSFVRYYNAYKKSIFFWFQRFRAITTLQKNIRRFNEMLRYQRYVATLKIQTRIRCARAKMILTILEDKRREQEERERIRLEEEAKRKLNEQARRRKQEELERLEAELDAKRLQEEEEERQRLREEEERLIAQEEQAQAEREIPPTRPEKTLPPTRERRTAIGEAPPSVRADPPPKPDPWEGPASSQPPPPDTSPKRFPESRREELPHRRATGNQAPSLQNSRSLGRTTSALEMRTSPKPSPFPEKPKNNSTTSLPKPTQPVRQHPGIARASRRASAVMQTSQPTQDTDKLDSTVRSLCEQMNLAPTQTGEYISMLHDSLIFTVESLSSLDLDSWSLLVKRGFPVMLRQHFVDQFSTLSTLQEKGSPFQFKPQESPLKALVKQLENRIETLEATVKLMQEASKSATLPKRHSQITVTNASTSRLTPPPMPVPASQPPDIINKIEDFLGPGPSPVKSIFSSLFGKEEQKEPTFTARSETKSADSLESEKNLEMFFDIYVLCHLRGDYLMTHDNAIQLAALLLQVDIGNSSVNSLESNWELYVPGELFAYDDTLESAILSYHRNNLKGVTPLDAKKQYIAAFRRLENWDRIIRVAVQCTDGPLRGDWFLGVTDEMLMAIEVDNEGTENITARWSYTSLKAWELDSRNQNAFNIAVQIENKLNSFHLLTDSETVAPLILQLITHFHSKDLGAQKKVHPKPGLQKSPTQPGSVSAPVAQDMPAKKSRAEEENSAILGQQASINVFINRESKAPIPFTIYFNMSVLETCRKIADQVMPDPVKPNLSLKKVIYHPQNPTMIVDYVLLNPTQPIGPQIVPEEYFYLVTYLYTPQALPINPKFIQFMFYETRDAILSGEWEIRPKEAAALAAFLLQATTGNWNPQKTPQKLQPVIGKYVPENVLALAPKIATDIISIYQGHTGMPAEDALASYIHTATCLSTYGVKKFKVSIDQKVHELRINAINFTVYNSPTTIAYECKIQNVNIVNVYPEHGIEVKVPSPTGPSTFTLQIATPEGPSLATLIEGYIHHST